MRTSTVVALVLAGASTAHADVPPAAVEEVVSVDLRAPKLTGTYDAKELAAAVKATSDKLVACYKKAVTKAGDRTSVATVRFTIAADGKVTAASATQLDQPAEACLVATFTALKLAKPKDGKPTEVSYPMTFTRSWPNDSMLGGNDWVEGGIYGPGYGYGSSGSGNCGGTGYGTIGTGRYGTIGKGYGGIGGGSGMRCGGTRGGTSTIPAISIGQPSVTGDLDKAIIRRYIKRNIQKLMYCYEKQLLVTPKLQGIVKIEFTIGTDGRVSTSKASGMKSKDVDSCVAEVIKAIEFPKPKGGAPVTVVYPITFRPTGG